MPLWLTPQPGGRWRRSCPRLLSAHTCAGQSNNAVCGLQGFLAEGLRRTSAGLGSVIIDSQPLTVALLASLLFGERLSAVGFGGLVAGVAGLCLLEVPPAALQALVENGLAGRKGTI